MSEGWIKLHRCLLDKAIWLSSTPEQKTILITLLLLANHEGKEWEWQGKQFKAQPGQFVTSLDSLAKKCGNGVSVKNVRTAIDKFKKYGFLTNESTKTGRLITIVNWSFYQSEINTTGKDIDKEVAKSRQSTGKQVATNKNDKNDKNNIFIPPSLEEVAEYCKSRSNNIDPQRFIDFYSSKGWMIGKNKMKDWKAAIRNWERNNKKDEPEPKPKRIVR